MKKAYPTYKETEIPWLPVIPNDWELKKMKFASSLRFSNVDKHSFDYEQPVSLCNYTDIYYNDFIDSSLAFMSATASQSEIEKFQISEGDVLVTKDSESWDDIAVPALVTESLANTLCGYHLALIKSNDKVLLGSYLFRLLQSENINTHFKISANGITRYGLSISAFSNVLIPLPSLPEQRQIAAYLDHKCALIDTFIAKKKRLIELLREQKQAIINQAVTRGIDPDAPLKPSGVEWLGDIPAHWEVKKLKMNCKVIDCKHVTPEYVSDGVPVVSTGNVKPGEITLDGTRKVSAVDFMHLTEGGRLPSKFDIIYSRNASVGAAALVKGGSSFCLGQDVCIIRSEMDQEFLELQLNSKLVIRQLERELVGSTFRRINIQQIKQFIIVQPSAEEQSSICEYISRESGTIDQTIERINKEVSLLKEYKTTLIAEAVTGKIDVREWRAEMEAEIPEHLKTAVS